MPNDCRMCHVPFRAAMIFELPPSYRFRMMETKQCAHQHSRSLESLFVPLQDVKAFRFLVYREES